MSTSQRIAKLFRKNPGFFSHIEGLRALQAVRVMLHHIVLFGAFFFQPAQYLEMLKLTLFKAAGSTFVLLDSFFVISGLVIGYSLINEFKAKGKVDIVHFFIRRCARVYPVYLFVLAFSIPLFYSNLHNIWTNLLQINNMLPMSQQYLTWAWTLAVEFQFYILLALFLVLLSKNIIGKKTCVGLSIVLFFLPFIITPIISITHHYYYLTTNAFVLTAPESFDYINMGFDKIYVHISALFYGVMTAYLFVYQSEKIKALIARFPAVYINVVALLLMGLVFFVVRNDAMWFVEKSRDVWQTSFFWAVAVQRNLYSLVLCLLLVLASSPRGLVMKGFVYILGSVLFRPFGRISFTTYLIHPLVFIAGYLIFFSTHVVVTAEDYFLQGLWLIIVTYCIAFPIHLFIEQPGMEKMKKLLLWFRRNKAISVVATEGGAIS